jgi:hypothetical protein
MSKPSEEDFFGGFEALIDLSDLQGMSDEQVEEAASHAERLLNMLDSLPPSSSAPIPMLGNDTATVERSDLRDAIASFRDSRHRDLLSPAASRLLKRLAPASHP